MANPLGLGPRDCGFESRCSNHGPLVKWLRHGPFTAKTWVQLPQGSLDDILSLKKDEIETRHFFSSFMHHSPSWLWHLTSNQKQHRFKSDMVLIIYRKEDYDVAIAITSPAECRHTTKYMHPWRNWQTHQI